MPLKEAFLLKTIDIIPHKLLWLNALWKSCLSLHWSFKRILPANIQWDQALAPSINPSNGEHSGDFDFKFGALFLSTTAQQLC